MIHTLKALVSIVITSIVFFGCSTTQKTSTSQTAKPQASDKPAWYQGSSFQVDSIAYKGFGEAIASDSVTAISNAELQAKVNLETGISEIVEETRNSLSEKGNESVNDPEFLILLRNASQTIQQKGVVSNKAAMEKDGYYIGFVTIDISKEDARNSIISGFSGYQAYLNILNSSSLFE